jgi:hypothetical protein
MQYDPALTIAKENAYYLTFDLGGRAFGGSDYRGAVSYYGKGINLCAPPDKVYRPL